MTTFQDVFNELNAAFEDRLARYQGEIHINGGYQIRGQVPNRNLAPLAFNNANLFTGLLGLEHGGLHTDLSNTGPGVPFQATNGADFTVGDMPFAFIDFTAAGSGVGIPLLYDGAGNAAFGPIDLASSDWRTGVLPPGVGGTGVNNASRTLTISSNSGTLLFSATSKTLTIPETITAIGRAHNLTAGRVAYASDANNVTDDASLTYDSANMRFHIGATPGTDAQALSVLSSAATASGSYNGAVIEHTFTSSSNLTGTQRGLSFSTYLDGSGGATSGNGIGIIGEAQNRQTAGTVNLLAGASIGARLTNAGNVTTAWGVGAIPILSGAGNLGEWRAFFARSPSRSSTGSITTAVGLYIERQKIAAGVTTGYGIFQENANDVNFFGGAIIMQEITAPGAPAANQGVLYLDDNGAGKSRLMIRFNTGAVQQIAIQP